MGRSPPEEMVTTHTAGTCNVVVLAWLWHYGYCLVPSLLPSTHQLLSLISLPSSHAIDLLSHQVKVSLFSSNASPKTQVQREEKACSICPGRYKGRAKMFVPWREKIRLEAFCL